MPQPRKIVVIGPECTGKSTLCAALSRELGTDWVPEYARAYLDELGRPYEEHDLLRIAEGQIAAEDAALKTASDYLICDTDSYVTKVWSEEKYGRCHSRILEAIAMRRYDLYLLTNIDVPWQADPQREHPEDRYRQYFYHQYRDIVQQSGTPWADIRGGEEERLQRALVAIQAIRTVIQCPESPVRVA